MVVWSDAFRRTTAKAEHPPIEFKPETRYSRMNRQMNEICYRTLFPLSRSGLNGGSLRSLVSDHRVKCRNHGESGIEDLDRLFHRDEQVRLCIAHQDAARNDDCP